MARQAMRSLTAGCCSVVQTVRLRHHNCDCIQSTLPTQPTVRQ